MREDGPLPAEAGEPLSDGPSRTVRVLREHALLDATWSRYETGERGPDPHVHHEHVDAFYVVEGELVFGLGPDVRPVAAPAGTLVLVPPHVVHTFGNEGSETVRWLNFHAPSTGFVAHLRGGPPFDSHDAPAGGGRDAADATVLAPGDPGRGRTAELADDPRLAVAELVLGPGEALERSVPPGGVASWFVLSGEAELSAGGATLPLGPRTWIDLDRGSCRLLNPGSAPARILEVRAPGL